MKQCLVTLRLGIETWIMIMEVGTLLFPQIDHDNVGGTFINL